MTFVQTVSDLNVDVDNFRNKTYLNITLPFDFGCLAQDE